MQKLSLTSVVDNMVMLGKANSLYYDDAKNNLYLHGKPFTGLQTGKLIGLDAEDRVYVQSVNNNEIYVISNEILTKKVPLTDAGFSGFYSNKKSVYAIYSNYIVNLSGDINTKLQFDKGFKFLGMGGSNAYFRDQNNNIIGIKSTIG
jgi:hypothetical protein